MQLEVIFRNLHLFYIDRKSLADEREVSGDSFNPAARTSHKRKPYQPKIKRDLSCASTLIRNSAVKLNVRINHRNFHHTLVDCEQGHPESLKPHC
jgi:hypothetical protein